MASVQSLYALCYCEQIDITGHVQLVTGVYCAYRMNMSSANAYSSIVDSLVNNAEWFFPGGKCELHVVTEVRLCQG